MARLDWPSRIMHAVLIGLMLGTTLAAAAEWILMPGDDIGIWQLFTLIHMPGVAMVLIMEWETRHRAVPDDPPPAK